jgi:transcriptional antiterminator NusG
MSKKWYIIHTYSGQEEKVKNNLTRRFETLGLREKIFRVLIPKQEVVEIKDGKKRQVSKVFYPGYLFVEIDMDNKSWYAVRSTPGVTGFVGTSSTPTALAEEEVKKIFDQIGERRGEIETVIHVEKGENVRIASGPFAGCSGVVEEINKEKGKLTIMIMIFGRPTPVEIDMEQVEKI